MAHTTYSERMGGCIAETLTADYTLHLPYGPGGARFYDFDVDAGGLAINLPDARKLRSPGGPHYTIAVSTNNIDLANGAGGSLGTLVAGNVWECYCTDVSTQAGTWVLRSSTFQRGTTFDPTRKHYDRVIAMSNFDFELADDLRRFQGWNGTDPVSVRVTIKSGAVCGSSTDGAGFDTGVLPAGSTVLLLLEEGAYIVGHGGDGGRGGDVPPGLLSQNGTAGRPGLIAQCPVYLVNHGVIAGGGGGGGGGAAGSSLGGGGGGGGAGFAGGRGGNAGNGVGGAPPPAGSQGVGGGLGLSGGGSTLGSTGGTGGGLGQAGSNAGGSGGAAGNAIEGNSNVTDIRTGTIYGSRV